MDRILKVVIRGDVSGLTSSLAVASRGVADLERQLAGVTASSKRQTEALNTVGSAFGKMGLAAAAGVGVSVKAAVDWETAWTGVTKTVNGSTAQLARLEDQLRHMARTMPATHAEIAAVAAAAGQLGVATPNIAEFTKIMVELGESTNLTADEAATSIAQLMNVMQTAPADVDNLGAALVALGNNGASTERDIIQMAQNIAGAGKTVGLSETDVLGLANALASVGIEAEAGGSAVSRILIDMAKAAKTGSKEMAVWQSVAEKGGLATGTFREEMEKAPAKAFVAFTKGLGRINAEGGDVFSLLEDLGQSDVRVTRALLGMANSGDLLADSLKLGASSFRENTALAREYGKRAETAGAKARVAWNGIKDNLIDIGDNALPVVKDLSEAVADLTGAFSGLPAPVQGGVLKMAGFTAAIGGSAFVVSRSIAGYSSLANSINTLSGNTDKLTRAQLLSRGGIAAAGIAMLSFADAADHAHEGLGDLLTVAGGAATGFAIGGPVGAAAGALASLASATGNASVKFDSGRSSAKEYADAIRAVGTATDKTIRSRVFDDLSKTSALRAGRAVGIANRDIVGYVLGEEGAVKRVNAALQKQYDLLVAGNATMVELANGGKIDAFNALAQALGVVTEEFDKGRHDAIEAERATQTWADALHGLPKGVKVELENLNYKPTKKQIDDLAEKYNLTPKQVRTILKAIDQASGPIAKIDRGLDALDGKVATTTIRTIRETFYRSSADKSTLKEMLNRADGGIVDYRATGGIGFYRDGGMRENHVAQIAAKGTYRVWAEEETGGEAYIPLAPEKRARSLSIWAETGHRLGVPGFADGDIVERRRQAAMVEGVRRAVPSSSPPAPASLLPAGAQLLLKSGALEIRNGKAYVEGIAEVVAESVVSAEMNYRFQSNNFARAVQRANGEIRRRSR